MKEAIGNAVLFNIIIVFVVVLIMFFVGSLAYSKAYKVKNKIIEEIEKQGESSNDPANAYNAAEEDILQWLKAGEDGTGIGYRVNTNGGHNNTSNCSSNKGELVNKTGEFEYCVYRVNTCENASSERKTKCGYYYKVTTYMYFDIPIIGELLKIPVNGETMIFTELKS